MSVFQFYEFILWETETNGHHVFAKKFVDGAYIKQGLNQRQAEEKFIIKLTEEKRVSISAHCFYNDIYDNISPPEVLKKTLLIINSDYMHQWEKRLVIKFCLCVLKDKLTVINQKDKFREYGNIMRRFDADVSSKNKLKIRDIIAILGLTQANIEFYLEKYFFPKNWKYLDEKIWSCYLQ